MRDKKYYEEYLARKKSIREMLRSIKDPRVMRVYNFLQENVWRNIKEEW